MIHRRFATVAMAAGAVLAAALIPVATAPTAGADEGGPVDTLLDLITGEAPGGEGGLLDLSDIVTGEGTKLDGTVDGFYAALDSGLDHLFNMGALIP